MSITEVDKIDLVASRPDSNIVKLVVTDHLEWDDLDAHSLILQEKIDSYLYFVESGQLGDLAEPALPADIKVCITLASLYPPPSEAEPLLQQIRDSLESIGILFEVEVRPKRK